MTNVNLSELYAPPSDMIVKAVLDHLLPFHLSYLKAATFFCLASGSADGLDASPRGGAAGFVHALDNKTVAFADWPGNNRIASLTNLQSDDRIGMLFLFPAWKSSCASTAMRRCRCIPNCCGRWPKAHACRRPPSW